MKILIYTRTFLPDLGGLERNTFTLGTALTELGHDTTVLTETLEENPGPAFPFKTVRSRSRRVALGQIRGAEMVFVNGGLSMKICLMCLFLGKKFVPVYQMASLYLRETGSAFSHWTRKFIAGRATMSVTVSHHARGVLRELLPGHAVESLPNPIDSELVEIAAKAARSVVEKKYDLLFAGRLIDGKGIFHLVDAVCNLRPGLDLKLAFAGDGEDKEQLFAHAKAKKLDIAYLGRLDREQLIGAYLQSRALVVPSSTHTEGSPLVIAEALSVGLPVVASDQPAMVEAIGDAGSTYARGSVEGLTEKLGLLFGGGQLAAVTRNTAGRKEEYSPRMYAERLKHILQKIQ